jgi:Uma2 family endonuclease
MNIEDYIEDILNEPDAPQVVEQIQSILEQEKSERYKFREWLTPAVKAEFINGERIMHSPVKRGHLVANDHLMPLLTTYVQIHQLGEVHCEKALIGLTRNDYEPDISFWKKERTGDFNEDTMVFPAPDFIVEILSKGTEKRDRGVKFKDYAKHNVKEYWLINSKKKQVEKYLEKKQKYTLEKIYEITETIESQEVSGFKIPVIAIFDGKEYLKALTDFIQK